MRLRWWRRSGQPADRGVRVEPAFQRGPAQWSWLPPVQRQVADHPVVNPVDRFASTLAAWHDPSYLGPLGHLRGPEEPAGVLSDLLRPSPLPQTGYAGPQLPVAVPPRRRKPTGAALQRSAAAAAPPHAAPAYSASSLAAPSYSALSFAAPSLGGSDADDTPEPAAVPAAELETPPQPEPEPVFPAPPGEKPVPELGPDSPLERFAPLEPLLGTAASGSVGTLPAPLRPAPIDGAHRLWGQVSKEPAAGPGPRPGSRAALPADEGGASGGPSPARPAPGGPPAVTRASGSDGPLPVSRVSGPEEPLPVSRFGLGAPLPPNPARASRAPEISAPPPRGPVDRTHRPLEPDSRSPAAQMPAAPVPAMRALEPAIPDPHVPPEPFAHASAATSRSRSVPVLGDRSLLTVPAVPVVPDSTVSPAGSRPAAAASTAVQRLHESQAPVLAAPAPPPAPGGAVVPRLGVQLSRRSAAPFPAAVPPPITASRWSAASPAVPAVPAQQRAAYPTGTVPPLPVATISTNRPVARIGEVASLLPVAAPSVVAARATLAAQAPPDPPPPAPADPPAAAQPEPTPPAATADGPTAVTGAGAGAGAGSAALEPEELLKSLYDPLLRRLRTELRLDRERRGAIADLPHHAT